MQEYPIWKPEKKDLTQSNMARFQVYVSKKTDKTMNSYLDLYQWSIDSTEEFWHLLSEFLPIKWHSSPSQVFEPGNEEMLGHSWFKDARLNFTYNMLENLDENKNYVTSYREESDRPERLTGASLKYKVAQCAHWLQNQGVGPGDRVVGIVSNTSEALIAMLSTAAIGAVWASCSPDFGVSGIYDRFSQIDPKVVFFSSSYQYNGKIFECTETVRTSLKKVPSIIAYVAIPGPIAVDATSKGSKCEVSWQDVVESTSYENIPYTFSGFDHPLFILFSSGTTGKPKCIVHSAGGTLLQHQKELYLHSDLGPDKRLLYFTTCGWMMWNWMASALSIGSGLVLYEGSVGYPDLGRLWSILATEKVQVFGTSPKYLSACMKAKINLSDYDLVSLEALLSTGSPLLPEHSHWLNRQFDGRLRVSSISGGTDIISCFMLGCPTLEVYPGEIQCRGLGMAVEAWDEVGQPCIDSKGELVCTKPFVSMPLGFWNDPDDIKYRSTYFEHYKSRQVWRHGDFIKILPRGSVIVYGRSDATLNPGGVRIGTAEIYRQVESFFEIKDSLVVGVDRGSDTEVWLFVVMNPGASGTSELWQRLKNLIKKELTPRHVPREIMEVSAIPYTRSGKKVEIPVARILAGELIQDSGALENPESLQEFKQIYSKKLQLQ